MNCAHRRAPAWLATSRCHRPRPSPFPRQYLGHRVEAAWCALRSGPSMTWLKSKNPASEAVRQEREEKWR